MSNRLTCKQGRKGEGEEDGRGGAWAGGGDVEERRVLGLALVLQERLSRQGMAGC